MPPFVVILAVNSIEVEEKKPKGNVESLDLSSSLALWPSHAV